MIDGISNSKHKAIFILVYSCCLELNELIQIRKEDLSTKRKPYFIKIRSNNGEVYRQAPISERIIKYLNNYWINCKEKPKYYLFEGNRLGHKYSITSATKVIKKVFETSGINSDSVIKVLRHSYMKHMVDLGIPIAVILSHLKISHYDTFLKYTKSIHKNLEINFTPIDKIIGKKGINEPEVIALENMILELESSDEQEYLIEAVQCFRSGSMKAGIVLSWCAFVRFIQIKCEEKGYNKINQAATKLKFKTKKFTKITDFENIKEASLLMLALELKILSKHQKKQMENNLDLRNHCGHPSSYKPELNRAKAFLEDILTVMKNNLQKTV
jgi:hypothetical protein